MTRIEKLTEDQVAQLAVYRERWLRYGLSTEPADRGAAVQHIATAYKAAGLEPPRIVVWLQSPLAGAIGAELLRRVAIGGAQVWAQVRNQVGAQVGDQVWAQVGDQVWAQVGAQVGDQVGDQVWAQVGDQVWAQVGDQVGDQVWAQVWAQVGDQVGAQVYRAGYGSHDASWIGFYQYFLEVLKLDIRKIEGLIGIGQTCGWWWPFKGAVMLTERPRALHRDERNRLHRADGPAIEYPDGWGVYAWHGQRVPERVIRQPESFSRDEILKEPNSEIVRVLAERLGWDRFLQMVGANVLNSWRDPRTGLTYELLEIAHRFGERQPRLLRMQSPKLIDDSAPQYIERVPGGITSARAGRAWQFMKDDLTWPTVEECNSGKVDPAFQWEY